MVGWWCIACSGLVSFTWERLTCGLISIFIQSKRRSDDVAPAAESAADSDGVISSSSSSSNHDQLPDDVITEILSRLPTQLVWKFQYVCKHWVEVTSTPSFEEMHYKNQPSGFFFVIQHFYGISFDSCSPANYFEFLAITEDPIDGYEDTSDVMIDITLCRTKPPKHLYRPYLISSYKGFLLFKHDSTEELVLIFLNPTTAEQVTVTAPASRYLYYGFYFHSSSKEYRVLYGVLDEQDAGIGFAALGLRTRSFRRIRNYFTHRPSSSAPPIILNGALHWVVSKSHHAHHHQVYGGARNPSCSETIMSFGTETEEFHVMPHPGDKCAGVVSGGGGGESHHLNMRLMEMEEHLCLCVRRDSSSPDRDRLDIWVLEDYKEWIWVKRHVVMLESLALCSPLPRVSDGEFVRHPTINALFIRDGELLLDSKLHEHLFFLYNLKKGSLRRLETTTNLEPGKKFGNIVVLQPSLVSLHSRIGYVLSLHDDQVAHWDLEYRCCVIPSSKRQHNWSVSKMLLEWKKYLLN